MYPFTEGTIDYHGQAESRELPDPSTGAQDSTSKDEEEAIAPTVSEGDPSELQGTTNRREITMQTIFIHCVI